MTNTITFEDIKGNKYIWGGENSEVIIMAIPENSINDKQVHIRIMLKDSNLDFIDIVVSNKTAQTLKAFGIGHNLLRQVGVKNNTTKVVQ